MGSRRYKFEMRIDGYWRNLAGMAAQLFHPRFKDGGKEGIGRRAGEVLLPPFFTSPTSHSLDCSSGSFATFTAMRRASSKDA